MPSVFETAPAASAIPITFASKATWDAICAGLPGEARQFALANGFAAKPGRVPHAAVRGRKNRAGAVRSRG